VGVETSAGALPPPHAASPAQAAVADATRMSLRARMS
jgi:hypothetical protein